MKPHHFGLCGILRFVMGCYKDTILNCETGPKPRRKPDLMWMCVSPKMNERMGHNRSFVELSEGSKLMEKPTSSLHESLIGVSV